jgi:hypothetical protein
MSADGVPAWKFDIHDAFQICAEYEIFHDIGGPAVPFFHFRDSGGNVICSEMMPGVTHGKPGIYKIHCAIPAHLFNVGRVYTEIALNAFPPSGMKVCFWFLEAANFTITEDFLRNDARYSYTGPFLGPFRPKFAWSGGLVENKTAL